MEFSVSGNALKTFARSITCLARVGNELVIQASASQLVFHTLNSSRSAYQTIAFKPHFFDVYTISGAQVQCSVLLKAICSVLRTPIASVDNLTVQLPDPDASKVQWTLKCYNGMKKAYWITCNVEPDIQQLSLDRRKFPSNFVVRPRDLNRLLANFQSSLQEITIIATETTSLPSEAANEIGGKAVELRSYVDPTKDPIEEFVLYNHFGDPVDVTFGVKELKAFLAFCEGCEVDIHLFFDKAGDYDSNGELLAPVEVWTEHDIRVLLTVTSHGIKPILMAPKFGLDDGSSSNFDATLVLATMLTSQLHKANSAEPPPAATTIPGQAVHGTGSQAQEGTCRANLSEHPSDHTRIWSELSGSAARSGSGADQRQVQGERNMSAVERREIEKISTIQISKDASTRGNVAVGPSSCQTLEKELPEGARDRSEINGQGFSQHHPSNWVDVDANDDDDDDNVDDQEFCVQSTPPYYEDQ